MIAQAEHAPGSSVLTTWSEPTLEAVAVELEKQLATIQRGDLARLYLHTLDWNIRAQKAFEKAGFRACGTSWRDARTFVVMEIWREQAIAARAPAAAGPIRQRCAMAAAVAGRQPLHGA